MTRCRSCMHGLLAQCQTNNLSSHRIPSASSEFGDLCPSESLISGVCATLDLCDATKVAFPSHGISSASSLEWDDPASESSLDIPAVLDSVKAFSPEISPFKSFTTTKASLGFGVVKPDVSIPCARRNDNSDRYEDHEDQIGFKDAESVDDKENYEEDMVLETDNDRFVLVFLGTSSKLTLMHKHFFHAGFLDV